MIRAFLFFLFTFALASCAAAADWPDVYAQRAGAVPVVDVSNGGYCSSVVINAADGYVVTAAHCIADEAVSYTVDKVDAAVVRVNRLLDLAVMKTRLRKGATTLPFAPAFPRVGSAVAVLGYPFGARTLTIQIGVVANADVDGLAWVNADLLPGDSGGAIVNAAGELVGITSGYRAAGAAHIGRVVPLETLRAFVEDLLPAPPAATK